jgi:phosphonate transport system ATP-binding protein
MIKIQALHKTFNGNVHALRGVNLEIEQGEFTIILGPSGAGKSTLLRCINGLEKPSEGQVFFNELSALDPKNLRYIRKKIGMIFQQFNLVKRLSVLQNVLCGRLANNGVLPTCLRLFPREDVDIALHCLERVGLADKVYNRADELSGGQMQRVGIARALAQRPDIILADEPIASLDPRSAEQIMDVLMEINSTDKITILVSLHARCNY